MIGSSQIGCKLDHPYWKFIFNKLYEMTSNFHNFIFIPDWIIPKSMVSPSYLHPFQSLASTSVPPIPLHTRDSLGTLQDSKCFFAPSLDSRIQGQKKTPVTWPIVLMEEILHLGCIEPCEYWNKSNLSTAAGFFPSRIKSMNYTMDMICIDCSVNWDGSPCPPKSTWNWVIASKTPLQHRHLFGKKDTFPCSSPSWIHWNVSLFGLKHVPVSMEIIKAQHPSHPLKPRTPWVPKPLHNSFSTKDCNCGTLSQPKQPMALVPSLKTYKAWWRDKKTTIIPWLRPALLKALFPAKNVLLGGNLRFPWNMELKHQTLQQLDWWQ